MSFTRFNSGNSFKRFTQPDTSNPYDTASVDNQISNATTRITDAGYKPENADKRNWLEKLTNLPQGQNAFFDTLEILGRPGQAVMGAVRSKQQGGSGRDALNAAGSGVSGKIRTRGTDLLEGANIDNPIAKTIAGVGVELALDPLMYVPGGWIAKGVSTPFKLGGKAVSGAYKAAEKAMPGFARFSNETLKPAAANAKDGLGKMFVPKYGYEKTLAGSDDNFLRNLSDETDNAIAYQTEKSTANIAKNAAQIGFNQGDDVGRVLESGLKINKDPAELLRGITKGDDIKVNVPEGDIKGFVGSINTRILSSKPVREAIERKTNQLKNVTSSLNKLNLADEAVKETDKYLDKLDRLQKAKGKLEVDLSNIQRGVHFNPLQTSSQLGKGEGFELINPKQRLYKKAIGNQAKLLDDIAPKGNFDRVVKAELKEKLRPIVEKILREGRAVIPLIKGTPEEMELRRIFGNDLQIINKKATTLSLRQGNKDSMYYALQGARPVIPESLTAPSKLNSSDGLRFDDIQFTDRGNPVSVPRPVREVFDSPEVIESAKKIFESNNEISQLAKANGIDIPEMQGYMAHVLTEEARKYKRMRSAQGGNFGIGNPNKGVVKTRKYDGSVEDVNELLDRKLFNPNAFIASAVGQKRLIEYIHAETFKNKVLNNPSFSVPFKKGMTVPDNAVVINPDSYKFFKVTTPEGSQQLSMGKGQEYIVTKGAKEALDRYQTVINDEGTKSFLKAFDTVQSLWKRSSLFSLGYHFRNQAGAMFNNFVGGMNPVELARYTKEGLEEVSRSLMGKESELFDAYRKQGLGSSSLTSVEYARPGLEPEQAIARTVENMSKSTGQKVSDRINPLNKAAWGNAFQTSTEVGSFFDQANRFALFKWAVEKKGMSHADAAKKVREVQFDYSKTTNFERNVLVRAFPFYRWMRNNIPFQIKTFINDPRKYQFLNNVRQNAQQNVGLNDENIPGYMKENFMIPVSGKDGKGRFLSSNLPLSDLTKLTKIGKTFVDSTTPLIKTPAELALNYNTFLKKPIQKFTGQQEQYQIPYTDVAFGVPAKAAYAFNQATGQIGRGLSGFLQKPDTKDQDTANRLPSLGISSLTKPFDAEKYAYYEKLDELKQLQDLMLFIQQQEGEKPRTVREINKGR